MIKVIINADDYGLREGVTNAIAYSMKHGLITQTTAMVNMNNIDEAVRIAKGEGFFDKIGLHLNLTYGPPLTKEIQRSRLICTSDGCFGGPFHSRPFHRLHLPRFEQMVIREEARAQMEKYLEYGCPLLHLDSHHHVHTDLAVAKIVLPLAKAYGFKSVRISRNYGGEMNLKKKLYKIVINQVLRNKLRHVDLFAGADDFGMTFDGSPGLHSFEVMTHPVYWNEGDFVTYVPFGKLYDYVTPIEHLAEIVRTYRDTFQFCTYADL